MSAQKAARYALAALLVVLTLFNLLAVRVSPQAILSHAQLLVDQLRGMGLAGVVVFAAIQIVIALSGVLPASLSAVAAGTIYGIGPGFLISAATTSIAADLAFTMSRSLFRPSIARMLSKQERFRDFDDLVGRKGWKTVCLLRVSPVMPFSATSYMLGMSKIARRDCALGTLAALPALFGYVAMGALAQAGLSAWAQGQSPIRWSLLIVGAVATAALGAWIVQAVIRPWLTTAD